jgi:methylase of polypeptide subunit release factors
MSKPPIPVDDTFKADTYYQQASQGAVFLWQGDFQNAKQLLQAVQRRIDKTTNKSTSKKAEKPKPGETAAQRFHRHRQMQAHKAQLLSRLLIYVDKDLSIPLRRAPDARQALQEALEKPEGDFMISLRELLGMIGAHEWRKKGVLIPALDEKIHPHYGIFSPARGEYLDLIAQAPLPTPLEKAFDIGTGTGVIAAILAKRGVKKIIATDMDPRAIVCAKENITRLNFQTQIEIQQTNLFPEGTADLIVCNPPWVPARPTARIEHAVYDENSQMLRKFLAGVGSHLSTHGEAWLIMSDLAEHLGLRHPQDLPTWIKDAGLNVIDCLQTKPRHAKASESNDLLQEARQSEITKLWRLQKI